VSILSDK